MILILWGHITRPSYWIKLWTAPTRNSCHRTKTTPPCVVACVSTSSDPITRRQGKTQFYIIRPSPHPPPSSWEPNSSSILLLDGRKLLGLATALVDAKNQGHGHKSILAWCPEGRASTAAAAGNPKLAQTTRGLGFRTDQTTKRARHITDQRGLRRLRKLTKNRLPGTRQPGQCVETRPPRQVVFPVNHKDGKESIF